MSQNGLFSARLYEFEGVFEGEFKDDLPSTKYS